MRILFREGTEDMRVWRDSLKVCLRRKLKKRPILEPNVSGVSLKNNLWEKLEELMIPLRVEEGRKEGTEERVRRPVK